MSTRSWSWGLGLAIATLFALATACEPTVGTFTVTTTADLVDANPGDGVCEATPGEGDCSLRAAIMEANATVGKVHVNLPAGDHALTRVGEGEAAGDLDVTGHVQIVGAGSGSIINANGIDRAFTNSGTLTLISVRVLNGVTDGNGGAVQVTAGGSLTAAGVNFHDNVAAASGGAIHVADGAQAEISHSAMWSNRAGERGGAVHVAPSGVGDVWNSTITFNRAGAEPTGASSSSMEAGPELADGDREASAAVPAEADQAASLDDAAMLDGRTRVIVVLDDQLAAGRGRSGGPSLDQRAQAASTATEAFLGRIAPLVSPPDSAAGGDPVGGAPVTVNRTYSHLPVVTLTADSAGLAAIEADPAVVGLEPDVAVELTLNESIPHIGADRVHAEGFGGDGWAVAVLDTGIDSDEPMTDGKVVAEACFASGEEEIPGIGDCPDGTDSQTGAGSGVNCDMAIDGCWHGTHVGSIAAGAARDIGGVEHTGVAPGADLISMNVFSVFNENYCSSFPCLLSWDSDQLAGLNEVLALSATHNIAAVNMSLGGGGYSEHCDANHPSLTTAIEALAAVGIPTVIAAGNDGYTGFINSPSCISAAVAVGATYAYADDFPGFTNLSPLVDLVAPGVDIMAELPNEPGDGQPDTGSFSGTSMAAPHVAGALAVLRSAHPSLSSETLLDALYDSGQRIHPWYADHQRISVSGAMALLDDRGIGGGIANQGTLTIRYTSVVSNESWWGGGVHNSGDATFTATAVVYNGDRNCAEPPGVSTLSAGYTLDSDWSCPTEGLTDIGRYFPALLPFGLVDSDTPVHPPAATSRMVDAIPLGDAGCGTSVVYDQRPVARPANGACDIGSYEYVP